MKVELDTPDKPEVVGIAARLRIDQDAVIGKLFRIWAWADRNSADGVEMLITPAFIDRLTNKKGFSRAMEAVGWLVVEGDFLTFPGFDRHNGTTAKARAESNRRVSNHRQRNAADVTNALPKPLPEKRRVEKSKNTPQPPHGGESGRGDFETIGKIKSMGRRWGVGGFLDAKEMRVYRKNREGWELYAPEDWVVVGEFMRASLAEGTAYFQPRQLAKALAIPSGLMADARAWKRNQRPPAAVLRVVGAEEPPATADEMAEIFGKRVNS